MPRASAADAAETARRILKVAADLFAVRGYAGVSLDDVAQGAGVTRGAVYHHYRSKPGLFRAVAAHIQSGVAAAVATAAEGVDDPLERLRAGSHAFLDAITARPAAQILLVDGPSVLGWATWRELDAQSSVVLLHEALGEVGVPAAHLDATTAVLSGAMNEAALWIADASHETRRAAEATTVLDCVLDAVVSRDGG